jgi:hypothetical protein
MISQGDAWTDFLDAPKICRHTHLENKILRSEAIERIEDHAGRGAEQLVCRAVRTFGRLALRRWHYLQQMK